MARRASHSVPRPAVSLKAVAKLAKCSISAAAAVLNGVDNNTRVGDDTRRRIEQAGKKLGYRRNFLARALRLGRSQMLGMITGQAPPADLHGAFWSRLIGGVQEAARARDCDLVLIGRHPDEDELDRGVRMLEERQVDALVLPSLLYADRLAEVDRIRGPVAVAFASFPTCNHPQIGIEHRSGIHEAVQHLAALGHREVLWLGHRHYARQDPKRKLAFDEAIAKCGLRSRESVIDAIALTLAPDAFIAACAASFDRIIESDGIPTSIIAFNDLTAMGACRALASRGLRVPADVSVIGYDDLQAELADPPMTSVSLRLDELGRQVGDLALRLAEEPALGRELAARPLRSQTTLVMRSSTGPRRA